MIGMVLHLMALVCLLVVGVNTQTHDLLLTSLFLLIYLYSLIRVLKLVIKT